MTKTSIRRSLRALACTVLLAGCAATPPATVPTLPSHDAPEAFRLEGRFSVRQDAQSHSGRLSWRHTADGDELLLSSPFGQGIAEIVATAGRATLTTGDGETFAAPDVPSLTERVLGYRLPLHLLRDWVRGRPAGAEVTERDAPGRPLRLSFEDWRIEYAYDGDAPRALPARIFAERSGAFELRLRIDEWSALRGRCPLKLPQQGNDSPAPPVLKSRGSGGNHSPRRGLGQRPKRRLK